LVLTNLEATLSNCGKPLKLLLPNSCGNIWAAKINKLGYGKKVKDGTMGNPQPSPKAKAMDAVQRLNVSGHRKMHKIKSIPLETRSVRGNRECCIQTRWRAYRGLTNLGGMLAYSN
jgi:hypothetical protein